MGNEGEKIRIFVAKEDWEDLLKGKAWQLRVFRESDLHYVFRDSYLKHVVEIEISKAG